MARQKNDIPLASKAVPSSPSFNDTDQQIAAVFVDSFDIKKKRRDLSANTASVISRETVFEPLEHSIYCGRERLGQYSRVGPKLYAAFDAKNRMLGEFKRRADAYAAISIAHNAPVRSSRLPKRPRR
jgi:hypothetical protein